MSSFDSFSLKLFVAVLWEMIQRNIHCWARWIIPSTSSFETTSPSLKTWFPSASTGGLMLIYCMISSIISSSCFGRSVGRGVAADDGAWSSFFSSFFTYFLPLFFGSLRNAASKSASSFAFRSISSYSSLFHSSSSSSITTNNCSAISDEFHSTKYFKP